MTDSILCSDLLTRTGLVRHGFTTRVAPDGEVFDMRWRDGQEARVQAQRASACAMIGVDHRQLRYLDQVHGNDVVPVDADSPTGRALAPADGLFTATARVPLAVRVADCAPVFLLDPITPAVALVHSGWRGALANIAGACLDNLAARHGSRPANCLAWIGPSISLEAFEVGEDVAADFRSRYGARWIDPSYPKPHVDIKGLIGWQLGERGVATENIEVSPLCSMGEPFLCSYRRDGPSTPHSMAVLELKE